MNETVHTGMSARALWISAKILYGGTQSHKWKLSGAANSVRQPERLLCGIKQSAQIFTYEQI